MKKHCRDLKEWRNCVVEDRYFNDERFGPGILVFICELNLKLLEAAFLMMLYHRQNSWRMKKAKEEQLETEKLAWTYFPDNLSKEELLNPYRAIKKIFKKIKPQVYRDYLQEWLHAALHNAPIDEGMMPFEVITVYENLLVLYSASWIIYQRDSKEHRNDAED